MAGRDGSKEDDADIITMLDGLHDKIDSLREEQFEERKTLVEIMWRMEGNHAAEAARLRGEKEDFTAMLKEMAKEKDARAVELHAKIASLEEELVEERKAFPGTIKRLEDAHALVLKEMAREKEHAEEDAKRAAGDVKACRARIAAADILIQTLSSQLAPLQAGRSGSSGDMTWTFYRRRYKK